MKFFKKQDILKEDYQKALKRVTLFFLSNPVPFRKHIYLNIYIHKQSLFRLRNKFRKTPLLVFVLSDQVWWCNPTKLEWFLSYSKNYIWKFMQANLWHHKLFHFYLPFWVWKVLKGKKKITNIWISREWKELFRWNKKHFS